MPKFKFRYVSNIAFVFAMLVLSAYLAGITHNASFSRDDSEVVWNGECSVLSELTDDGQVGVSCSPPSNIGNLYSDDNTLVVMVANTSIPERSAIAASCDEYQSGRWMCQFGDSESPIRLHPAD